MNLNKVLKFRTALLRQGKTARGVSRQMGKPDAWLSKIYNDYKTNVPVSDQKKVAKILKIAREKIFPEEDDEESLE